MFLLFFFFKDGLTFVLLCLFDRVSPASQVVFRCTHLSPPVSAFQVRGGGGGNGVTDVRHHTRVWCF